MQVEIGKIYEGKITGITKFGAFVSIDESTTGMVHISEIAHSYVNEITDHISEGQIVKVKVLGITDEGKISLSIKKTIDPPSQQNKPFRNDKPNGDRAGSKKPFRPAPRPRPVSTPYNGSDAPDTWEPRTAAPSDQSFEEMLNGFKQKSEEKMSELKKITENKRKGASRKGK